LTEEVKLLFIECLVKAKFQVIYFSYNKFFFLKPLSLLTRNWSSKKWSNNFSVDKWKSWLGFLTLDLHTLFSGHHFSLDTNTVLPTGLDFAQVLVCPDTNSLCRAQLKCLGDIRLLRNLSPLSDRFIQFILL
jgi:hypothetical protein